MPRPEAASGVIRAWWLSYAAAGEPGGGTNMARRTALRGRWCHYTANRLICLRTIALFTVENVPRSSHSLFQQPASVAFGHGLAAVAHVELAVDAAERIFDRLFGQVELLANLTRRVAAGHPLQDLLLSDR